MRRHEYRLAPGGFARNRVALAGTAHVRRALHIEDFRQVRFSNNPIIRIISKKIKRIPLIWFNLL
jgi:hypothetical protein